MTRFINDVAGRECVTINKEVMDSEMMHAERNKALAYFLKAYKNFENNQAGYELGLAGRPKFSHGQTLPELLSIKFSDVVVRNL